VCVQRMSIGSSWHRRIRRDLDWSSWHREIEMGFDYSRGIEGLGGSPLLSWYRMIGMGLLLGEEGSEWISTDLRVSTASVSPEPC